jgi:hypothetical protein
MGLLNKVLAAVLILAVGIGMLEARAKIIWVDGTIVFNGGYDVKGSSFTQAVEEPTQFEILVATCGLKFANRSDYIRCLDDKDYLSDKLDDLKPSEMKGNLVGFSTLKKENNKR